MSSEDASLLVFEYTVSTPDLLALQGILYPDAYRKAREANTRFWVPAAVLFLLAAYLSYESTIPELVALFVPIVIYSLYRLRVFRSKYRSLQEARSKVPSINTRLEVGSLGLRELAHGVESIAPWSAVIRCIARDDRVFIELRNRQWAIVHKASLSSSSASLNELIESVRAHGIDETPLEPWKDD